MTSPGQHPPEENQVPAGSVPPEKDPAGKAPLALTLSPTGNQGRAAPPAALATGLNVMSLLAALRRRWVLVLVTGSVCALATAAAVRKMVPAPKAIVRATLKINSNAPRIVFPTAEAREDFQTYQRTQAALIKSRKVLHAVYRQVKGKHLSVLEGELDPLEWLEQNIQVDFSIGPEFMRVSMNGDKADELVILVNTVMKTYLEEIVSDENKSRRTRLELLQEIADRYEGILKGKREALRKLAKTLGSGESKTLALKHRLALEQLGDVQKELLQVQANLRKQRAELDLQESRQKRASTLPISEAAVEERVNQDRRVKEYQAEVSRLEEKIDQIKRASPAAAEGILDRNGIRDDLRSAQKALEDRRREVRPQALKELRRQQLADLRTRLADLKEKTAQSEKFRELLDAEVQRLDKETRQIGETSFDLETTRDEIERTDQVAKVVTHEVEALKVELAAPPRITPFEDALVYRPSGRKSKIMMVGVAGLGVFAGIAFAICWWDFRARRIHSVEEVVQGLGIRLVGTLPRTIPHRRWVGSKTPDPSAQEALIESVDAARTVLLYAARTQGVRVVMVTSALEGEGKTSVAGHLAVSLARAGYKTLLIDGDLRRPAAHRLFLLPLEPGFSELLRAEVLPGEAVRATAVQGLWMIPGGRWSSQVVPALNQGGVGTVLDQLKEAYDFVVVDSAPVLPVADSLQIGQHVDAAIFSVLSEVSRLPTVYAAHQRLAMFGIPILGAVVNGTRNELYESSYYRKPAPVVEA